MPSRARPAPASLTCSPTTTVMLPPCAWSGRIESGYLVTETEIEGDQYPPLSDIAPAAFVEECEIYEQFGIQPATGKPLNRLMLPPHAGPDFPRLGHRPDQPPEETHAPHTVGGQAFEFPFGPVRQVGVESLYYGLVTSGEEVVDLYLFTWHKHRGVERRLRGTTPREAIFLAERAEGLSAVAVGWAFAAATEAALGIAPPSAAARTRAVALELERLYNHAAATAALCQATGLTVGQSAAEIALERLLRVNAAVFGHRYLFGVIDPGGAGRGPDADVLRRELPGAYGELRRAADALLATNSFVDRLEATGILTAEQARRLGLVGPVARATGLAVDARLNTSGPRGGCTEGSPYAGHLVKVVTAEGGDVFARFQVMLGEAAESVRLIDEFLDAGTAAERTPLPVKGEWVAAPALAGPSHRAARCWPGSRWTRTGGSAGPGCAQGRCATGAASTTPAARRTYSPTSRSSRPASG